MSSLPKTTTGTTTAETSPEVRHARRSMPRRLSFFWHCMNQSVFPSQHLTDIWSAASSLLREFSSRPGLCGCTIETTERLRQLKRNIIKDLEMVVLLSMLQLQGTLYEHGRWPCKVDLQSASTVQFAAHLRNGFKS